MSKSTPRRSEPAAGQPSGPSFEQALAELERIVEQMESGTLTLEQSLAAHRRGLELAKYCRDRLEAAQQQVQVLEGEVLRPLAAALESAREDRGDA